MAAAAIPIVAKLGGAVLGKVFGALAQHSLRLHDAQAENSAVPQAVTALQQDFSEIAQALSDGQVTPQDAMQQLMHIESSIQGFLQSLVGKPGTAWAGAPSGCPGSDVPKTENGVHNCDKTCTAGCCIFYNYLEPAIDCFMKRLQRTGPGGSFQVGMPAIPGNKYGFPNFPAYVVTVKLPTKTASLASSVLGEGLVSKLLGTSSGSDSTQAPGGGGTITAVAKFPKYIFLGLLALVLFFIWDRA